MSLLFSENRLVPFSPLTVGCGGSHHEALFPRDVLLMLLCRIDCWMEVVYLKLISRVDYLALLSLEDYFLDIRGITFWHLCGGGLHFVKFVKEGLHLGTLV